jgi:hypothetical protein
MLARFYGKCLFGTAMYKTNVGRCYIFGSFIVMTFWVIFTGIRNILDSATEKRTLCIYVFNNLNPSYVVSFENFESLTKKKLQLLIQSESSLPC